MTTPAALNPNHVTAYPACVAGVTLNSPTVAALGRTGKVGAAAAAAADDATAALSISPTSAVSVRSSGFCPTVPVLASSAARSIHNN